MTVTEWATTSCISAVIRERSVRAACSTRCRMSSVRDSRRSRRARMRNPAARTARPRGSRMLGENREPPPSITSVPVRKAAPTVIVYPMRAMPAPWFAATVYRANAWGSLCWARPGRNGVATTAAVVVATSTAKGCRRRWIRTAAKITKIWPAHPAGSPPNSSTASWRPAQAKTTIQSVARGWVRIQRTKAASANNDSGGRQR